MAKYSIAIDNNVFVSKETQELIFTPAKSNSGETLPYGLGWFIQYFGEMKFIWHFGYGAANSTLILKVPEKELTFIILANNYMLSKGSPGIGTDENVMRSEAAQKFLELFVLSDGELPDDSVPLLSFYKFRNVN